MLAPECIFVIWFAYVGLVLSEQNEKKKPSQLITSTHKHIETPHPIRSYWSNLPQYPSCSRNIGIFSLPLLHRRIKTPRRDQSDMEHRVAPCVGNGCTTVTGVIKRGTDKETETWGKCLSGEEGREESFAGVRCEEVGRRDETRRESEWDATFLVVQHVQIWS